MIKLFVMDVDGTLTDGKINISNDGEIYKSFNVKDGLGISMINNGFCETVIITARKSDIVKNRALELNINHLYQGVSSKLDILVNLANDKGIHSSEIAYIGDDLSDIECIKYAGFSACPFDATAKVKNSVNYVSKLNGGSGAVRDFIDYLISIGEIKAYDI